MLMNILCYVFPKISFDNTLSNLVWNEIIEQWCEHTWFIRFYQPLLVAILQNKRHQDEWKRPTYGHFEIKKCLTNFIPHFTGHVIT